MEQESNLEKEVEYTYEVESQVLGILTNDMIISPLSNFNTQDSLNNEKRYILHAMRDSRVSRRVNRAMKNDAIVDF